MGPGRLDSSKPGGGGSGGQAKGAVVTSLNGTLPAQTQLCSEQTGSSIRDVSFLNRIKKVFYVAIQL